MGKQKSKQAEPKMYQYCLRCGRKLVTEENKIRGMGKVCWEKSKIEQNKQHKLF